MNKRARTLDDRRIRQALAEARTARERVILLLSIKAGLRAKEIAALEWDRVDFEGRTLLLDQTKGNRHRHVPIASDLHDAMVAYRDERGSKATGRVLVNVKANPGAPLTANAVAVWLRDFYRRRLGWEGFSSHSGRRTMITRAARKIVEAKGSLKDVQALAGHADLQTTSRYIDTDEDAQRRVVDLI